MKPLLVCVGLRRWKAYNLAPLLQASYRVVFVSNAARARRLQLTKADSLAFWGGVAPAGLQELSVETNARLFHIEDGFVRSVGLGSDLIRPLSLVLDEQGIYFDATRPSGLEHLLNTADFSPEELSRAQQVRDYIVQHGITKYNLEPRESASWQRGDKPVVLVTGQVEDDASIRLGCTTVCTNTGLLQAVRLARPDAFIVYKSHPDVMSGNRRGKLAFQQALQWADHVETNLSVVNCIDACDEVHTMTSLTGFDALLRGKRVVTYGIPFYAGWGLTTDMLQTHPAIARRTRRLQLDELTAAALLRYPVYWDWSRNSHTTCEAVLHRLVETRHALEQQGGLEKLRSGWWRRQARKVRILAKAWLAI